ncbi:hypothetical protein ASE86_07775 [Sphingomonas sp. Leaf33]|uniref:TniQ family protein n=1 Tax=Sphingomonas sp. Leaf33 TaxID=1736215 RepID=UPI0006F1E86B|nr:TniQ family protein [Sphingomonas sp. Leaf33]KQN26052.1 hypothetical protein ASE86_07775 [Sphingomonas sp. Leaf33]
MDGTVDRQRTPFGAFLRNVGDDLVADRGPRVPSTATARAEWRRLDKQTPPMPGESLRGLVARACKRNDIPNSWGVLQHLGLLHRNSVIVSEHPGIDPAELAYALGVAEHEVVLRRYEPTVPGRVSFQGLELNVGRIEKRIRRFSPSALADPAQRFHRAVWELKDIPFCFVGWDMLQDRCFCEGDGIVQGWTRTLNGIEECDKCGDPLHRLEPFAVPPEIRPALSILQAIVDPHAEQRSSKPSDLPPALRDADRTQLYRLIIRLARALDADAEEQPIEEPARRLNGLHLACEALGRWPSGWESLQWHDATTRHAISELRQQWRTLAPSAFIVGAGDPAVQRQASTNKRKTMPAATDAPTVVGIRPAYELARLSPEVMLAVWENALVTQHVRTHGDRNLPAFDIAELDAFASAWHDRVEPDALSYRLGIPYYGLEQIVAIGTIVADGPALPGTGHHFRSATINDFLTRISENAGADLSDPVPLKRIMESIGGRAKPWGPLVDMLHRAAVGYQLSDGICLVDSIRIDRCDADRVRSLAFERDDHTDLCFRSSMVQRDALEILNVGVGGKRLLAKLEYQGTNPRTYATVDVEKRAAAIMSIPELAARLGINWSSAHKRARLSGAKQIIPGGWDRTRLLELR